MGSCSWQCLRTFAGWNVPLCVLSCVNCFTEYMFTCVKCASEYVQLVKCLGRCVHLCEGCLWVCVRCIMCASKCVKLCELCLSVLVCMKCASECVNLCEACLLVCSAMCDCLCSPAWSMSLKNKYVGALEFDSSCWLVLMLQLSIYLCPIHYLNFHVLAP